jgi:hypothetical protein
MKKILKSSLYTTVVLSLLFSNLIFSVQAQSKNDKKDNASVEQSKPVEEKKLKICHYPPGNPDNVHTIEINENSLKTHLEHGDYTGECKPIITPVPTSYPTTNPFPEIPTTNEPTNLPTYEPIHQPIRQSEDIPSIQGVTNDINYDKSLTSLAVPVYRFFNILGVPRHFYTVSEVERNGLIENNANEWRYEGIAFFAWIDTVNKNQQCNSDKVEVHRFYSQSKGNHMFTIDENEVANTKANPNYIYEGVKFCVFLNDIKTGLDPVYRFWHTVNDKHFFTISEVERSGLESRYVADGSIPESESVSHWNYEGLKFYAIPPHVYGKYYLDELNLNEGYSFTNENELCGSYKYDLMFNNGFAGYYVYSPYRNASYLISISHYFLDAYKEIGDYCGFLGLPRMNAYTAANSPQGNSGYYQMFDKGGIYYNTRNDSTFAVYGRIFEIYEYRTEPGGTGDIYGFPTDIVRWYPERNSLCQEFEGGLICENENDPLNQVKDYIDLIKNVYLNNASQDIEDIQYKDARTELIGYFFDIDTNSINPDIKLEEVIYFHDQLIELQREYKSILTTPGADIFETANRIKARYFLTALYVANLRNYRFMNQISDLEVFAQGAEFIASYWDDNEQGRVAFESDLAVVFANREGTCVLSRGGCFDEISRDAYFVSRLGDSGFSNIFRDSKYFMVDPKNLPSNQIFHTMGGGINFAFAGEYHCYGATNICKSTLDWLTFHETAEFYYTKPSDIGDCGTSFEDLFASYVGVNLGRYLKNGDVSIKDFGDFIRYYLGENHYDYNALIQMNMDGPHWDIEYSQLNIERLEGYNNAIKNPLEGCTGQPY